MDNRKKPKTEKWLKAMADRRGNGANQYTKAKALGNPKPELTAEQIQKRKNSHTGKTHTAETTDKIRISRLAFLPENPHMVPYKLNHYSKGRSYPEEYWKAVLDSNNLIYEEQYQIGIYQLDFAFVDLKIDLEIDGDQHYLDQRIAASDIRRTKYLEELGWKTIRVRWSNYKKLADKKQFVDEIVKALSMGS